jgi:hypothetical protein
LRSSVIIQNDIKENKIPEKILNFDVNDNSNKKDCIDDTKMIEKLEKNIKRINSDNFIKTIKYILTLICIGVLVIYIIIIYYQGGIIDLIHKTFQCYYFNLYTKNIILHFQTVIIEKFYIISNITDDPFSTEEDYKYMIKELTPILKKNFHYFTTLYFAYNIEINHDFFLMWEKRKFKKLTGHWEETTFLMDFPTEMDSFIYNIHYSLDIYENEIKSDIDNFIFRYGIEHRDNKTKVYTNYI